MTRVEYLQTELDGARRRLETLVLDQNDRDELIEWIYDMHRELAALTGEPTNVAA